MRLLIKYAMVLAAIGTYCPSSDAKPFHSARYGYTLEIPADWTEIPGAEIQAMLKAMQNSNAKSTINYDSAFQPKSNERWFEYPYVVIQVISYKQFGSDRQINEDEFPQFVKSITGMDLGKAVDSTVSPNLRSVVSNVQGLLIGYFGHESLVQINFCTKDSDSDRYDTLRQRILDSFRFDPEKDYSVAAATANPSGHSLWSGVGEKAIAGAIIGGLIGVASYLKSRFKKSSPTQGKDAP
jgi:hypothetical protein